MSGPLVCSVCTAKFGFFKKSYNCGKCNCTACKDCLSQKATLPGDNLTPVNLCRKCFDLIQNPPKSGRVSPPANFKREMERKLEKEKRPETPENPENEKLRQRLKALKESHKHTQGHVEEDITVDEIESRMKKLFASNITNDEIEYRLAKLKGSRPPAIRVHSIKRHAGHNEATSSKQEPSSVQEKKLIRQFTEEVAMEIDTNPLGDETFEPNHVPKDAVTPDDLFELALLEIKQAKEGIKAAQLEEEEIKQKLAQLQDVPETAVGNGNETSNIKFDEESMDAESAELIKRIMEEDRLEQNMINRGISLPTQKKLIRQVECAPEPEDEFPWCFMCNDDATTRCLTCDRELYCKTCFRVAHRDSDMRGHKTEKFVNKNKAEED